MMKYKILYPHFLSDIRGGSLIFSSPFPKQYGDKRIPQRKEQSGSDIWRWVFLAVMLLWFLGVCAWNSSRLGAMLGYDAALGAMPGADLSGYAGFEDDVDNHYFRIFGSAILMSLIGGGMSYAVDNLSNSNADSGSEQTTMQDEMTSALAAQLGQTSLELLQKNLTLSPTLKIRPGFLFNIMVTKDMAFGGPYAAR